MRRGVFFLISFFLLLSPKWFCLQKEKEPLRNWIKGPVEVIVLSSEKRLFEKLKTDAERRKFIEIFWKRRDPNPETSENEFKKEFEKRKWEILSIEEHSGGDGVGKSSQHHKEGGRTYPEVVSPYDHQIKGKTD